MDLCIFGVEIIQPKLQKADLNFNQPRLGFACPLEGEKTMIILILGWKDANFSSRKDEKGRPRAPLDPRLITYRRIDKRVHGQTYQLLHN